MREKYTETTNINGLSHADLTSLHNLAAITNGSYCVDVDSWGHVEAPYIKGTLLSAFWRSAKGQSGSNLANIEKLMERVFLASEMFQADCPPKLLSEALSGLARLKDQYSGAQRTEVLEKLEKVLEKGNRVLSRIIEKEKSSPKKATSEKELNELLQGKKGENESVNSSGFRNSGVTYYIRKIEAFLIYASPELSQAQLQLMNECKNALAQGVEVMHAANYKKTINAHGNFLARDIHPYMLQNTERLLEEQLARSSNIGVIMTGGFNSYSDSHTITLGVRRKGEEYFLTQYNSGIAATGSRRIASDLSNTLFHMKNLELPLKLKGETVVTYGPYTKEEIVDVIIKNSDMQDSIFASITEASQELKNLFDEKKRLPPSAPDRRFQLVGNCYTASVLEWLVDTFQRHREHEIINRFNEFGQDRGLISASISQAQRSGMHVEDAHNLSLEDFNWPEEEVVSPQKNI